jgi:hypothetical protein
VHRFPRDGLVARPNHYVLAADLRRGREAVRGVLTEVLTKLELLAKLRLESTAQAGATLFPINEPG